MRQIILDIPEESLLALKLSPQALGEEEFKTAWERGRALTLEQTIDYALRVSQPVSQS
jgi:hypothetical protein